ncbi:MAG TPA: DUF4129 domain-containing protein [Mycobacterium sp.]|nr:DUF4129 domain-containing protein [Mycobacterium sp.]
MPAIDIDREAAREAAERELAKPIYPKASLTDRIGEWIDEFLNRLVAKGSTVPGGWLTISVLVILVLVALIVGVRIARNTMRTSRSGDYGLFGAHELTAAEHRAAAERAAAQADWAAAIRHRLRAVARQLEEAGILNPVPGRTATELARDAGGLLPGFAGDFAGAATTFNDVTYGERPGTEPGYRMIADLDDRLRSHASAGAGAVRAAEPADTWTPIR